MLVKSAVGLGKYDLKELVWVRKLWRVLQCKLCRIAYK